FPPLAGRVYGGQGPKRAATERLVQRARRLLPGVWQARGRPGHGIQQDYPHRAGAVRFHGDGGSAGGHRCHQHGLRASLQGSTDDCSRVFRCATRGRAAAGGRRAGLGLGGSSMQPLGPEQLNQLWQAVERQEVTEEEYALAEEKMLEAYSSVWRQALLLEGHADLQESLLAELSRYLGCADLAEIRRRCQGAVHAIKDAWNEKTSRTTNRTAVEEFYNQNQAMLYELMWWHGLGEDTDPLGYVTALYFAQQHG